MVSKHDMISVVVVVCPFLQRFVRHWFQPRWPCPSELDRFLDLARKSCLASRNALIDAYAEFRDHTGITSGDGEAVNTLCQRLVQRGILTEWQCRMLRDGRWKGFFLDKFKLLRLLRDEEDVRVYLAEDTRSENLVEVAVLPRLFLTDNKVQYVVRPHKGA